ncbi:NUDIX domain-containing protein [Streptomyces sp. NPDC017248]|uniref:NUDIX domain-containing protein n=1 Tax=unclassified Streptomyces TaxID=2593676 RepID=UPI0037985A00
MPQQPINDVMLVLERAGAVCPAERRGTGYADGMLNLPSGKLDEGEDIYTALIREAREETGIVIERDALRIVHVTHYRNPEGEPFSVHGWYRYAPHTIRPAV